MENKIEQGIPTHGGAYVMYNVLGNLFEVSSKYIPPIQPVGRGAYGIVCCARNSETNEEVAIKKIGDAFNNRIDAKRTLREIKLLSHMDHDNVIKIKDIIRPPQRQKFDDVYIVYELMDTDLHHIIRSNQLTDDHCQALRDGVICITGGKMVEMVVPSLVIINEARASTDSSLNVVRALISCPRKKAQLGKKRHTNEEAKFDIMLLKMKDFIW